jgi:ubiquinone/menaquinone biosynthesis C-methylase UbiE
MEHSDEIERLRQLYKTHYPVTGTDISYTWHPRNPISIYYRQAQERSLVSMLNSLGLALEDLKVLDIGCGSGYFLRFFASLGADPANLFGIDLIPERLMVAQRIGPGAIHYSLCDAQYLPFQDDSFDLSCLFTVFSSIIDHGLRVHIAQDVTRIIKDGGYLLWYDMCYSKSTNTQAIKASEIESLFPNLEPVYRTKIHSSWISRVAKHSFLLCEILDQLPFLRKTHNLFLLKKGFG